MSRRGSNRVGSLAAGEHRLVAVAAGGEVDDRTESRSPWQRAYAGLVEGPKAVTLPLSQQVPGDLRCAQRSKPGSGPGPQFATMKARSGGHPACSSTGSSSGRTREVPVGRNGLGVCRAPWPNRRRSSSPSGRARGTGRSGRRSKTRLAPRDRHRLLALVAEHRADGGPRGGARRAPGPVLLHLRRAAGRSASSSCCSRRCAYASAAGAFVPVRTEEPRRSRRTSSGGPGGRSAASAEPLVEGQGRLPCSPLVGGALDGDIHPAAAACVRGRTSSRPTSKALQTFTSWSGTGPQSARSARVVVGPTLSTPARYEMSARDSLQNAKKAFSRASSAR